MPLSPEHYLYPGPAGFSDTPKNHSKCLGSWSGSSIDDLRMRRNRHRQPERDSITRPEDNFLPRNRAPLPASSPCAACGSRFASRRHHTGYFGVLSSQSRHRSQCVPVPVSGTEPNRQLAPGLQCSSWVGSLARGAVCGLVHVHSAGGWLALVASANGNRTSEECVTFFFFPDYLFRICVFGSSAEPDDNFL